MDGLRVSQSRYIVFFLSQSSQLTKILKCLCPFYSTSDLDPALQLHNTFDDIMTSADCMFTPVDGEAANDPSDINNWYTDYSVDFWRAERTGYVNRSWCRLELLAAATVPVDASQPSRLGSFAGSLKHYVAHACRPHLLYSRMEELLAVDPIALPPLRFPQYSALDPRSGSVTIRGDQRTVDEVLASLKKKHFDPRPIGYFGESQDHQMHGQGVMKYESGSQYKGSFVKGRKHGYGVFVYAKGNSYRGDWLVDKKCGKGVFMHTSGNVYEGMEGWKARQFQLIFCVKFWH